MFLVLSTFALFSTIFTVAKPTLESGGLFFLLGSRMVGAGLLLLLWVAIRRPSSLRVTRSLIPLVGISGALNFFLTNVFEFLGLAELSSWKACFIYNFSPFISALLGFILLREKMNARKWLGLLLGSFGISLIFAQDLLQTGIGSWELGWGELFALAAVFCSCLGWSLLRKVRVEGDVDPFAANGYGMILAGLGCLAISGSLESWDPVPIWDWEVALSGSGYMLVVSNLLAYTLYASLLKRFSATFLALAGGSTSLFAALWGALFLHEAVDPIMIPATLVGLSGLILFYREEIREELRKRVLTGQAKLS
jgi:drug/metabolite transporter (DMT)-like permease